mgnify:CR=1 FL=1
MDLKSDFEFSTHHVIEAFLSVAIVAVSTAFILSNVMGNAVSTIPLSIIFYSVVPLSMAVIGFLTYKVGRMVYESSEDNKFGLISPILMSLLLAVVAINVGFMMLLSSTSPILEGIGKVNTSYLIVVLSMSLSMSVLIRNFTEIE